jgi:hypothetical protein
MLGELWPSGCLHVVLAAALVQGGGGYSCDACGCVVHEGGATQSKQGLQHIHYTVM